MLIPWFSSCRGSMLVNDPLGRKEMGECRRRQLWCSWLWFVGQLQAELLLSPAMLEKQLLCQCLLDIDLVLRSCDWACLCYFTMCVVCWSINLTILWSLSLRPFEFRCSVFWGEGMDQLSIGLRWSGCFDRGHAKWRTRCGGGYRHSTKRWVILVAIAIFGLCSFTSCKMSRKT